MVGTIVLKWLVDQDRTVGYLARQAGVDTDALVHVITGGMPVDAQDLLALEHAMGVPEGKLQQAADVGPSPEERPDPLVCFTVKQVALMLQVSEDTVRAEVDDGVLGSIVVGQRVRRIPRAALEDRLSRWEKPG